MFRWSELVTIILGIYLCSFIRLFHLVYESKREDEVVGDLTCCFVCTKIENFFMCVLQVFDETLRITSVFATFREATTDVNINGFVIFLVLSF